MLATIRRITLSAVPMTVGLFFVGHAAQAATYSQPTNITVGAHLQSIQLFDGHFAGGANIASGDLNGDGVPEYIVGAGKSGGPQVEVYSQAGTKLNTWFALDKKTTAGIFVAAGDLDGDGQAEVVVAPDDGFKPEVDVYSGSGEFIGSFTAFESSYTGGVHVAVIDARNGQPGRIVAGSGSGRDQEVKVFDWPDFHVEMSWQPYGKNVTGNGVFVAGSWSSDFGEPVIAATADTGRSPLVLVYGVNSHTLLSSWLAYDPSMKSGINVALYGDTVMTAPEPGGGPQVRQFDIHGRHPISSFVLPVDYRGGLRVAATSLNGITVSLVTPTNINPSSVVGGKAIEVILSKQELHMIENGKVVSIRKVSTGKWSTPTPTGTFKTYNKTTVAYSKAYGLYMEYWMAITPDGKVGLHSLPYWRLKGGGKLYEGAAHIGTPVSHGCVRQTVADAKSLYDWAPVGTPVTIVK